jgi:putative 2-oxoglutarate-Fe(II)-dependent oxygenase superfamily protein
VPRTARISAWGLISRGEGFNAPHIHHKGWATGVYYPAAPEGGGPGGALRIGPPPALGARAPGWPDATIRPEPGLLVLIPSFYTHWTVPLGRPGLRTSIAFDLVSTARSPRRIDGPARLG